ncbi:head GIN domain-containing protein [Sediminibacterium ginsengisoli]|uniref:Putative auto-transporter adhesin, head GIN domain n=1 Tax=Sediminibacterium ginsengisoli TaxID=413434 RepID=A0A1T4JSI1_9BACT|nr:head GIN domain-containing protein [Sediminibacterium ginsengisoli]SJZ33064.1 Putative auto-transporter adhesin, head GIN domain [Sediminibacterium ginsengisoli]
MKRSLLKAAFFVCSICLVAAACTKYLTGSGAIITENRQVSAFDEVRIDGDADLEIRQGTLQQVTVSGYENLVPVYRTSVANRLLVLGFNDDVYNIRKNNIKVQVIVPDIKSVLIHGSGAVSINGFLTGTSLKIRINGSGNIDIGNSAFNKAAFEVNGSGNIRASAIPAGEVVADIHGSGNIEVNCLQKLTARINGSGSIDYWGSPGSVDTQISGNGRVRKRP